MIRATTIGFRYSPFSWIYRNYSFHLERGKALAILGPNGKGKTTLLRALLGIAPPQEGILTVSGAVGYVPQHAPVSFLAYSVLDMVLMGRIRHMGFFGTPQKKDRLKAMKALEELGLENFAQRSFLELSGGERQLVLMARALASDCSVLLLDEPTSALDFKNEKLLLQTMGELKEKGLTLVFTTHAPHQAIHVADSCLLMYSPEKYLFGDVEELLQSANLRELYDTDIRRVHISQEGLNLRTVVPVYS